MFRAALILTTLLGLALPGSAQTAPTASVAAEADVLAYRISGYSGIFSVKLPSKLQVAFGSGHVDDAAGELVVPGEWNFARACAEHRAAGRHRKTPSLMLECANAHNPGHRVRVVRPVILVDGPRWSLADTVEVLRVRSE